MKQLKLNALNVQEMEISEMKKWNGGVISDLFESFWNWLRPKVNTDTGTVKPIHKVIRARV